MVAKYSLEKGIELRRFSLSLIDNEVRRFFFFFMSIENVGDTKDWLLYLHAKEMLFFFFLYIYNFI